LIVSFCQQQTLALADLNEWPWSAAPVASWNFPANPELHVERQVL